MDFVWWRGRAFLRLHVHVHALSISGDDDYPIIEGDVVGIELPPQPAGVTRLIFGSGPFGVTVYGTGNGLVVTHVEPEGSGAEQVRAFLAV